MSKEKAYPSVSFDNFPIPTYEEWKDEAVKTLKGEDFDKKLLSKTPEGITLKPIYTSLDVSESDLPGFGSLRRGASAEGYLTKSWHMAQKVSAKSPSEVRALVIEELEGGANAISLELSCAAKGLDCGNCLSGGAELFEKKDMKEALGGTLDLEKYGLYMNTGPSSYPFVYLLAASKTCFAKAAGGHIGGSPLSTLAACGTLPRSIKDLYDEMAEAVKFVKEKSPNIRSIIADGLVYANGGADSVTEVACLMGEVSEYMFDMTNRGLSPDEAASSIGLTLSISSNFFMEIAKIRAMRILFAQITKDYGACEMAQAASIHGVTTSFNKSKLDPYTNALRLSTEAFSGIVAGLDALSVEPFDSALGSSNAHSRRISRNIATMMSDEFGLNQPIDPAGGSYYVEALSNEFVDKAWAKFMEFEEAGGFYMALLKGIPQEAITKGLKDKKTKMATRQLRAVGVNMYANAKEDLAETACAEFTTLPSLTSGLVDKYDISPSGLSEAFEGGVCTLAIFKKMANAQVKPAPHAPEINCTNCPGAMKCAKVHCEPVLQARLSEDYEALRQKTVEMGGINVLLLNMGPVSQHKARSDFSAAFFETGGFTIHSDKIFERAEDAIEAITDSTDICVICSTDDNYPALVPAIAKGAKARNSQIQVILAGMPAADLKEAYLEAGLTDFIHIRSNCLETLQKAQSRKGAKTNA